MALAVTLVPNLAAFAFPVLRNRVADHQELRIPLGDIGIDRLLPLLPPGVRARDGCRGFVGLLRGGSFYGALSGGQSAGKGDQRDQQNPGDFRTPKARHGDIPSRVQMSEAALNLKPSRQFSGPRTPLPAPRCLSARADASLRAKFNFSRRFEGDFDQNLKTPQFPVTNFVLFSL